MEVKRLMNFQKKVMRARQNRKLNRTIQKVFKDLRQNRELHVISEESISDTTVISRNRNKSIAESDDLLIISDDEDCSIIPFSPSQSLQCSTPKPKSQLDVNDNLINARHKQDVTKEINADSFVTIDLAESTLNDEVIVVDDTNSTLVSNTDTVLDLTEQDIHKKKLIAKPHDCEPLISYLDNVILNRSLSENSVGSNIYHPNRKTFKKSGLRMIVIDGSNVAVQHSRYKLFSVEGLKICIDYFLNRGHVVKAFVPRFRCKRGMSTNPKLLDDLEKVGVVIYTPSREVNGKIITPYDDRYIIQCAAEFDGIIVSGDNYRDLINENPTWRFIIENRLLPFTWVDDMIMFPKDPLGRNGPNLDQFLRHET